MKFHVISLKDGYYDGFQFWVDEKYNNLFDLHKSSRYCLDNDEAQYHFGMCRSLVLRKADAEKRKIAKLLGKLAKSYEYLYQLGCAGVFSNGEAIYTLMS